MDDLYIGLMSGTSLDGIDACLVDLTDNHLKQIGQLYLPYPDDIGMTLAKIIENQQINIAELARLDDQLALLNVKAVNGLLDGTQVESKSIKAIGYHGQTIFHDPEGEHPNTIQIGNPALLAAHTDIRVVADFRRMDMAVGGQGAPLAPAFHQFLFRDDKQDRAILNIGGIANLTLLPANPDQPVTGFDSGPGNCLLNEWIQINQQQPFDKDGRWAQQGNVDHKVLQDLLQDPYFSKPLPKSTGREYFHLSWLQQNADIHSMKPEDVQATLTALTVNSIVNALQQCSTQTRQVYVCGGGAYNKFMISLLKEKLGSIQLAATSELGLDPDWVEACAFAWLAQQRILQTPANIPSVTGARKQVLLGTIYQQ